MSKKTGFQSRVGWVGVLAIYAGIPVLSACSGLEAADRTGVFTAPGTTPGPSADGGVGVSGRAPDDRGERPPLTGLDGGLTNDRDASISNDATVAPVVDASEPSGPLDVPDDAHCASVRDVDPKLVAFEERVLVLINESRARGEYCGSEGTFDPTGPLVMQPQLRCAARLHSLFMAENEEFSHTQSDGMNVGDRIVATGYHPYLWGENIASGQTSPENAVEDWLLSDGHCRNLMDPEFEETGIGLAYGRLDGDDVLYWTQKFATP